MRTSFALQADGAKYPQKPCHSLKPLHLDLSAVLGVDGMRYPQPALRVISIPHFLCRHRVVFPVVPVFAMIQSETVCKSRGDMVSSILRYSEVAPVPQV